MITLILGAKNSGKSAFAEKLVSEASSDDNRYYIATMIPYGEEGAMRVEKHRKQREGLNFKTIEMTHNIDEAVKQMDSPKEAFVLLECIPNLVANEMFEYKVSDVVNTVLNEICILEGKVKELYIVSYNDFGDVEDFDAETLVYINNINYVNQEIEKTADRVYKI